MRASRLYGADDLRVVETQRPTIAADEVLVAPERTGICPSGVDAVANGDGWGFDVAYGFPGHEFCGEVVEVGDEVAGVSVGDRVVADLRIRCGTCRHCRNGRDNICENLDSLGSFAHAEYLKTPGDQTYVVPEGVPTAAAAFTEPVACVLRSFKRSDVPDIGTVAVVGAGQMGLLHLQVIGALSNAEVIVTDLIEDRLELARDLGADLALDAGGDVAGEIDSFTDGDGPDSVIVTVSSPAVQESALDLVEEAATVTLYAGIHGEDPTIAVDPNKIHYGEVTITGTSSKTSGEFVDALELISSGALDLERLITHELPLEDLQRGMELADSRAGIKIMIAPQT